MIHYLKRLIDCFRIVLWFLGACPGLFFLRALSTFVPYRSCSSLSSILLAFVFFLQSCPNPRRLCLFPTLNFLMGSRKSLYSGILGLTLPPTCQPKRKNDNASLKTTNFASLYDDGRLDCYPGDPFTCGSQFEACKPSRTLHLSPYTGWASVEAVPDTSTQILNPSLSFAIRRKSPVTRKPSLRHLGLHVELLGEPATPSPPEPKDRRKFKVSTRFSFQHA